MSSTKRPAPRAPGEVAFPLRDLLDAGVQDTVSGFAKRLNTSHQAVRWVLANTPTAGVVGEKVVTVARVYGRLSPQQRAQAVVDQALGRTPTLQVHVHGEASERTMRALRAELQRGKPAP